jgi:hypothetical protein
MDVLVEKQGNNFPNLQCERERQRENLTPRAKILKERENQNKEFFCRCLGVLGKKYLACRDAN